MDENDLNDDDESEDSSSRKLFLVTRQTTEQIVVSAYLEKHIEESFDWDAAESEPWHKSAVQFTSRIQELEMLPASFYRKVPLCENGETVHPPKTCEEILLDSNWEEWESGQYQNLIDDTIADGLINGAAILKPPANSKDIALYMQLNVYAVKSGVYFTTISPLPVELEPYFVCYSIRPKGIHKRDSE
jgi:hypothetical protein